jgi:myo-inositol-1(or 4)-monophosphatase
MEISQKVVDEIACVARDAGSFLMRFWHKKLAHTAKPGQGFATEADTATEDFIIERLSRIDSTVPFWAEERGRSRDDSDWYWVIDPLDGTTNFSRGLAYFCVSIALTYKHEPQVGVIYAPVLEELFVARKDHGAFLNGTLIRVSSCKAPEHVHKGSLDEVQRERCLMVVNLPYASDCGFVDDFKKFQRIRNEIGSLRIMGSAALELAHVAAGRFDGVFFQGLAWWDVAAGICILREAGATVSQIDGTTVGPHYQNVLASGATLYDRLRAVLRDDNDDS